MSELRGDVNVRFDITYFVLSQACHQALTSLIPNLNYMLNELLRVVFVVEKQGGTSGKFERDLMFISQTFRFT
jgi:hypothetical protein